MAQTINDSIIQIVQAELADSNGTFTHTGDYTINGTLTVSSLVTRTGDGAAPGNFTANSEQELNGQGIHWKSDVTDNILAYRLGSRLWTNANFDLSAGSAYKIDNNDVLTATALGGVIRHSSLTSVGTLESLAVSGDTSLADFAFFSSTFNRLGLGVEEPEAAINILENNVSIVLGSPAIGTGQVGTFSNHDFAIVTDNLSRITVKNNGDVTVAGNVTINGQLTVSNIVSDSRIDRTHPLEFNATRDTSIYGLGLIWSGTGYARQLIMMSSPDRLYTTESFDIGENQTYHVNGKPVLSETALGAGVVRSNLSTVGTLDSLTVSGLATLHGGVDASTSDVTAKTLTFNDGDSIVSYSTAGANASSSFALSVQNKEIIYGDGNQISIGDKSLQAKPVKVFGKLSVGINNPDPTVNFSVNGDVSIGGKRFTSATEAPTSGSYQLGDICWNSAPHTNSYVGWVCVVAGTPGQWCGFGQIAS
jgi:hypothetical protein